MDGPGFLDALAAAGAGRGDPVALVVEPGVGIGAAVGGAAWSVAGADVGPAVPPLSVVAEVEAALRPRWVLWSGQTALILARAGIRVAIGVGPGGGPSAVVRWLAGRRWSGVGRAPTIWPWRGYRRPGRLTCFPRWMTGEATLGTLSEPTATCGPSGPRVRGQRARSGCGRWAALAQDVAARQSAHLAAITDRPMATVTARSESGAELLCAEMTVDGLPMDRAAAESIIAGYVGPRPRDEAEAAALRVGRDGEVLGHVAPGVEVDLRSNGQVKALLGRLGIEVADTRAWRLREVQDRHPVVAALLAWRKAERMSTTYGYRWLDEHLGTRRSLAR